MISGIKICGVSDLKTLKYITEHPCPPQFIGFITNYKKSKRYVDFEKLKELLNVEKNGINFVSVTVNPDGEILERIPVETNAYACMLGGDDLKTLFICTSNASGVDPDSALREKSGKIEIVEVDIPGAGRP